MGKCIFCGFDNAATAKFCGRCGKRIPETSVQKSIGNDMLLESKGCSKKIKSIVSGVGIFLIIFGIVICILGMYGLKVGYHTRMASAGQPYVTDQGAYYSYALENYTSSSDYPIIAFYLISGGICILGGIFLSKLKRKLEKSYVRLFEDHLEGYSGTTNSYYSIRYSEITGITYFSSQITEGVRVNVGQALHILYFVGNGKNAYNIICTQRNKMR